MITAFVVLTAAGLALIAVGLMRRARRPREWHGAFNAVMAYAATDASMRGHEATMIDHVALALTFDPAVSASLRAAGVDVVGVRADLDDHLGRHPEAVVGYGGRTPALDAVLELAGDGKAKPSTRAVYLAIVDPRSAESHARALFPANLPPTREEELVAIDGGEPSYRGPLAAEAASRIAAIRFRAPLSAIGAVREAAREVFGLSDAMDRFVAVRLQYFEELLVGSWTHEAAADLARAAQKLVDRKHPGVTVVVELR